MASRKKLDAGQLAEARRLAVRIRAYLAGALEGTGGLRHTTHCLELAVERIDELRKILDNVKL